MQVDQINLNTLRVFAAVYKSLCMTTAAKELHLTQSGVSQHIRSLEESLGKPLFDRIHRKIVPTDEGEKLFKIVEFSFSQLEEGLSGIFQSSTSIRGVIRVGMPIEFGINRIIPLLAEVGREHEGLEFNIQLDFASKMNQELIEGKLDFAFVDDFAMDRRISMEKVTQEVFLLCCSKKYFKEHPSRSENKEYFESLDYLAYQDGEHALRSWFQHHIKKKIADLRVRARVMDVEGLARFILNDLGVGILPDHKVDKLIGYGYEIHVFKGSARPLRNTISLAYLEQKSLSRQVAHVLDFLRTRLK